MPQITGSSDLHSPCEVTGRKDSVMSHTEHVENVREKDVHFAHSKLPIFRRRDEFPLQSPAAYLQTVSYVGTGMDRPTKQLGDGNVVQIVKEQPDELVEAGDKPPGGARDTDCCSQEKADPEGG